MRRINLLPQEVVVRRRQRQQSALLVVVFIVFLVLLGGLWFLRQSQLRQEEDRLAAANARIATLETQVAALQEFAQLERTVKEKEATLATSMANDLAWSRLLIELSMIIPGDSWISSLNATATPPQPGVAPPPGAPGPAFGNLSFSATTFDFPGVAKWITRLQELQSLQNIWVPSAVKGELGGRDVVNFSSTTDLSGKALSGRYQTGGPQ